jgi:RNA exonuclease 4
MEPVLSSNWKKLQEVLNSEPKGVKSLKVKAASAKRQQNSVAKCKRIDARLKNSASKLSMGLSRGRAEMGIGSSSPEERNDPAPSTSLALWADDNDISAKDLLEAYGVGTSVGGPGGDKINGGLSKNVEVGKYVAMDCEMVGVGGVDEDRSALARVSIVNFHGIQVYDSYVRPKEIVTDWRTHVSGVSPKHMATARPFEEVQKEVADILRDRVLIGHSVKHDLDVVMLSHPKVDIRDTSRFSGFRKYSAGKTPSLKTLAKEVLGIDIQDGEHSSIEDARAAVLLFRQHKQAFDVEHARHFQQRTVSSLGSRSKAKKKGKNKR